MEYTDLVCIGTDRVNSAWFGSEVAVSLARNKREGSVSSLIVSLSFF